MKITGSIEDRDNVKTCSRKLFFPKKLSTKETLTTPNEVINFVTSLLRKVVLDKEKIEEGTDSDILSDGTINEAPLSAEKRELLQKGECHVGVNKATTYYPIENNDPSVPTVTVSCKKQQPTFNVNNKPPSPISHTNRIVQKWKKLARNQPLTSDNDFSLPPMGEMRTKEVGYEDEHMFDAEVRRNFKKMMFVCWVGSFLER